MKSIRMGIRLTVVFSTLLAWVMFTAVGAGAKGLPKTFAWTAYGVKSSGYAQSVAIGNAWSAAGHKWPVIPATTGVGVRSARARV